MRILYSKDNINECREQTQTETTPRFPQIRKYRQQPSKPFENMQNPNPVRNIKDSLLAGSQANKLDILRHVPAFDASPME